MTESTRVEVTCAFCGGVGTVEILSNAVTCLCCARRAALLWRKDT